MLLVSSSYHTALVILEKYDGPGRRLTSLTSSTTSPCVRSPSLKYRARSKRSSQRGHIRRPIHGPACAQAPRTQVHQVPALRIFQPLRQGAPAMVLLPLGCEHSPESLCSPTPTADVQHLAPTPDHTVPDEHVYAVLTGATSSFLRIELVMTHSGAMPIPPRRTTICAGSAHGPRGAPKGASDRHALGRVYASGWAATGSHGVLVATVMTRSPSWMRSWQTISATDASAVLSPLESRATQMMRSFLTTWIWRAYLGGSKSASSIGESFSPIGGRWELRKGGVRWVWARNAKDWEARKFLSSTEHRRVD
ncbi:hypothetical protein BJV78DRAFT_1285253 [Lactifluus subvellereus]|nr:hypothetical protein BJV78DRAFT_1285253 [Lactifluus subvellereus]